MFEPVIRILRPLLETNALQAAEPNMTKTAHQTDQALTPSREQAPERSAKPTQAKALRRARWHTAYVRILRIGLPLSVVALAGLYAWSFESRSGQAEARFTPGTLTVTPEGFAMDKPTFTGFMRDGARYKVVAGKAFPNLRKPNQIKLQAIRADLVQKGGRTLKLTARRGFFDNTARVLDLYERIDIVGADGLRAAMTDAKILIKEQRIISDKPVFAMMETGSIRANAMVLEPKVRRGVFKNSVLVRLKPNDGAGFGGAQGQPIDVSARTLFVDDKAKAARFEQSVTARQGDNVLTAAELDVRYEGEATLPGTAPQAPPRNGGAAPEPTPSQLTSLFANGGVVIDGGSTRRVSADAARFNVKDDTALLTGKVVLVQGRNRLSGGRLRIDRRAGRSTLDTPAVQGRPAGRISTLFFQDAPRGRNKAKRSREGRAAPIRFRSDPNAPITIDAALLRLNDKAKAAVFSGNVKAQQGRLSIQTVALFVSYSGDTGLALKPRGGGKAKAPPTQLTKIEARKKVVVRSADGQTATGDWATFDVRANTLVMGGNVTLVQGKTVLQGEKLLADLTTGETRLVRNRAVTSRQPFKAQALNRIKDPSKRGCPPGRMCGLFYPGQLQDALGGTKKPGKAQRQRNGRPNTRRSPRRSPGRSPGQRRNGPSPVEDWQTNARPNAGVTPAWKPSTSASPPIR
ncbi:MAG: LptA/OstA family protein [Pseudomonadota bacterium]